MPVNNEHKELIQTMLKGANPDIFILSKSEGGLHKNIGEIAQALNTNVRVGAYAPLSKAFHNPKLFVGIEKHGDLTVGEIREYLIEHMGALIGDIALKYRPNDLRLYLYDLGWNEDKLLEETRNMENHNDKLTIFPSRKARDDKENIGLTEGPDYDHSKKSSKKRPGKRRSANNKGPGCLIS